MVLGTPAYRRTHGPGRIGSAALAGPVPRLHIWTGSTKRGATAVQIAPDALADQKFTGNLVHDSLSVLGAAAFWDRRRFGFTEAAWTLIGSYIFGRLLAPPR